MPKVSGIFDAFDDLDKIPAEDVAEWLTSDLRQEYLENYIANRIIYPQVAPVSEKDIDIDLGLLREILKNTSLFYKPQEKKIYIPDIFVSRLPILSKLVWSFIDSYHPKGITTLVLTGETKDEVVGTCIAPSLSGQNGHLEIKLENKNYRIKLGSLTILPCTLSHCHINFQSKSAKIMGKNEITFEVLGGKLGIVLDGRIKK